MSVLRPNATAEYVVYFEPDCSEYHVPLEGRNTVMSVAVSQSKSPLTVDWRSRNTTPLTDDPPDAVVPSKLPSIAR